MLPQRSGVHEISSPSWKKSEPDPVLETARLVDVERLLVPPEPETVRALVERVELRIAERLPPIPAERIVPRLSDLPPRDLLERGRYGGHGTTLVIGTDHAATGQDGDHGAGDDRASRDPRAHDVVAPGATAGAGCVASRAPNRRRRASR